MKKSKTSVRLNASDKGYLQKVGKPLNQSVSELVRDIVHQAVMKNFKPENK